VGHHKAATTLSAPPTITVTASVPGAEKGVRVRALYEYSAVDEGELSFNPGDVIIQVSESFIAYCDFSVTNE
jgi:hypothetical protein